MNGTIGTVYRAYDADGRLLYVGLTTKAARIDQHRVASEWFPLAARIDLQHFATWAEAAQAEAEAIDTEQPLANRAHPIVNRSRTLQSPIWAERKRQGMSREQLGVKAGVSGRTLARLESTAYQPAHSPLFDTITRIAEALGVNPVDLFSEQAAS